jgi:3'-phosphoadenosine 5'-phosphosulfate sulfotransferase (PAPS reductase)/FAD synthetase
MAKKKATGICLSEVRDSLVASSKKITADFKAAGLDMSAHLVPVEESINRIMAALPTDGQFEPIGELVYRPDPQWYDYVFVCFSGGKDSIAALILMDKLVKEGKLDREKVILMHHDIDDGSDFMDWPCTPDYCRKLAAAFGYRILFSWRAGGFLGELTKTDKSDPIFFEQLDGTMGRWVSPKVCEQVRIGYPAPVQSLTVRWCSYELKINPALKAFTHDPALRGKKVLVITGERREESNGRAYYAEVEIHKAHARARHGKIVHQWRPVLDMTTQQVWDLLREYKVNPHPCYRLGWGRCSCSTCIFGNDNMWASAQVVLPEQFKKVSELELKFNRTIDMNRRWVTERAAAGRCYNMKQFDITAARSKTFDEPIFVDEWIEPAGAKGELDGPC